MSQDGHRIAQLRRPKQVRALHLDRNASTREFGDQQFAMKVAAIKDGDIPVSEVRILPPHRLDGVSDEGSFLLVIGWRDGLHAAGDCQLRLALKTRAGERLPRPIAVKIHNRRIALDRLVCAPAGSAASSGDSPTW